ncbi:uncharacterized protein LOC132283196 [Cornus florida]|uniref:uncharacterized protein LOC132283196 n=1 Tax=Cornus florida TaxID=4283 RepID=UPI00289D3489|nr:uncharacterized protein LOC132283196 [Cornus florida]
MYAGEEKTGDFYSVLGLKKECSAEELRTAYKKLALRWHPDRCSASANSKYVDEAKKKFQAIQEAYSVLSDVNKRFLYDVGVHDCDDDENGMGDFMNELVAMMSQNQANENGEESFEELQELFEEMFQGDIGAKAFSSTAQAETYSYTSYQSCGESSSTTSKRNSSQMNFGKAKVEESSTFNGQFQGFCLGAERQESTRRGRGTKGGIPGGAGSGRRNGRKHKVSSSHDVSSND